MTDALPDWLRRRAWSSPDRLAIECGDIRWTFRELDQRADAAAARLHSLGVQPGDRVALLAANSAAFAQVVFGAARVGAVLAPLNLRLSLPEIAWQLQDCQPSLLITDRPAVLAELSSARATVSETLEVAPLPFEAPTIIDIAQVAVVPGAGSSFEKEDSQPADAPLWIMYTSGTSGRPKGAVLTHGNIFWSAFGSMAQIGVHEDDRWLVTLPLFHVGGLSILFRSVLNGTTAVIHETFDPARANQAIDTGGVTIISVVTAMLLRMLEERQHRPFPATLRCVLLGGGPAPPELIAQGLALGIPIAQTYGLTETASQATTLVREDIVRKAGSAGKALLPTEIRIEREDGSVCPPGEVGEIVVRGATVSPGYWRRPEESAAALRNGWLHSGDAGYQDEEGYLYVIDRRDDLIVSGGENVYPAEVEAVLSAHPAVREAGVFALPDPVWSQAVSAAVSLYPGANASREELNAFCRERLAGYKIPRQIFFTDELPRTASGKLLRRQLRERFSSVEDA